MLKDKNGNPIKVRVTVNGQETEAELVALPDGFLTGDQFEQRFGQRSKSMLKNYREKLAKGEELEDDDQALLSSILEKHQKKAGKGGELSPEQLQAAEKEWEKKRLQPLMTENDQLKGKLGKLSQKTLYGEIERALRAAGVKEEYLQGLDEHEPSPFIEQLARRFGEEEKHGFVLKDRDKDGEFVFSAKPGNGRVYKGVAEAITDFAGDQKNKTYFGKPAKGGGAGLGNTGATRTGGVVELKRSDAIDAEKYDAAEKTAKEQGARVVIVD